MSSAAKTSSGRKRRTQADRREESSERILDAAEALFARKGFHGVTMREIAELCDTKTSLLHYYFDHKIGLYNAVIARRAPLINSTRLEALEAYEKEAAGQFTAEGVVRAYLAPTFGFMLEDNEGYRSYGALIASINASNDRELMEGLDAPFDPVVRKLIDMLAQVRPDCDRTDLYWFYHTLSGAITLSLVQNGRIDALSGGACRSDDFKTITDRMTEIYGAGLMALPGKMGN